MRSLIVRTLDAFIVVGVIYGFVCLIERVW